MLLCGAYSFQGTVCEGLFVALPEQIALRGADRDPALQTALGLLAAEIGRDAPGQ